MRTTYQKINFEKLNPVVEKAPPAFEAHKVTPDILFTFLGGNVQLLGEIMAQAVELSADDEERSRNINELQEFMLTEPNSAIEVLQSFNAASTQDQVTARTRYDVEKTPFDNLMELGVMLISDDQESYRCGETSIKIDSFGAKAIVSQTISASGCPINEEVLGLPHVIDYMPYLKTSLAPLGAEDAIVIETYLDTMGQLYEGAYQQVPVEYDDFVKEHPEYEAQAYSFQGKTLVVANGMVEPVRFQALAEHLIEARYKIPINLVTLENYEDVQVDWDDFFDLGQMKMLATNVVSNPVSSYGTGRHTGRKSSFTRNEIGSRYNGELTRKYYGPLDSGGNYPVLPIMDPWRKTKGKMSQLPRTSGTRFWRDGVEYIPDDVMYQVKEAVLASEDNVRFHGPRAMFYLAQVVDQAGIVWEHFDLGPVNPLEIAILAFLKRPRWGKVWKVVGKNYIFNKV
jgi:hypothetical protein